MILQNFTFAISQHFSPGFLVSFGTSVWKDIIFFSETLNSGVALAPPALPLFMLLNKILPLPFVRLKRQTRNNTISFIALQMNSLFLRQKVLPEKTRQYFVGCDLLYHLGCTIHTVQKGLLTGQSLYKGSVIRNDQTSLFEEEYKNQINQKFGTIWHTEV